MKYVDRISSISDREFVKTILKRDYTNREVTRIRRHLRIALDQDTIPVRIKVPIGNGKYRAAIHMLCEAAGRRSVNDRSTTKIEYIIIYLTIKDKS